MDEDSANDDLGSAPTTQRRASKPEPTARADSIRTTPKDPITTRTVSKVKSAPNLKHRARTDPPETSTQTVSIEDDGDDDDDDDPFGIKKMRVRRAKSRDQMRKPAAKETVDLIPSFL